MNIVYKALVRWPGDLTESRRRSRFGDVAWGKTLKVLDRELALLGASNIIFQVAVEDHDIRLDGGLRAGSKKEHPGVIITFDSIHGPLSYWTDEYDEFADNVRAIALSLEALRAVDRHGVNKKGSQYEGYKRLPGVGETGNGRPRLETPEQAAKFVAKHVDVPKELLMSNKFVWEASYKEAAKRLHPDNKETGDDELFVELQDAAVILKGHHG